MQANRLRLTVIVLDSAGLGVMPKHPLIDDGANTIANTAAYFESLHPGEFRLPNLQRLGLGNIATIPGVPAIERPAGAYGLLSLDPIAMTDTITGHWGLMGLNTGAFPTYPNGIPREMMEKVEAEVSRRLGEPVYFLKSGENISGTTVIEKYGDAGWQAGRQIVYTSSDSVFQIAVHVGRELSPQDSFQPHPNLFMVQEDGKTFVVDRKNVEKMYRVCQACREVFNESPDWNERFLRVIARPFATRSSQGALQHPGSRYVRITSLRRDLTLALPGRTILDVATAAGYMTKGVGKFFDIFSGQGIQRSWPSPAEHRHLKGDMEGIDCTLAALREEDSGIIGVNLVDLDEQYGHRNDPIGYAQALMAIDRRLPEIWSAMGDWDIVMITADHGNDPTRGMTKLMMEQSGLDPQVFKARGTNHTREFVPLLVFGNPVSHGVDLGVGALADVGATIGQYLGIFQSPNGSSFYTRLSQ